MREEHKELAHSFSLLPSYWQAISEMEDEEQKEISRAIIQYGFTGTTPAFTSKTCRIVFSLIAPVIDSSVDFHASQSERGKRSAEKRRKKRTDSVPETNQTCTKAVPEAYQTCTKVVPEAYQTCTKVVPEAYQMRTELQRESEDEGERERECECEYEYESESKYEDKCSSVSLVQPSVERKKENYFQKINFQTEHDEEAFQTFWQAYPKKQHKPIAKNVWNKLHPPLQACLDSLNKWKQSPQWCSQNGQFIPLPENWLECRSWEDEPPLPAQPTQPARTSHSYFTSPAYHGTAASSYDDPNYQPGKVELEAVRRMMSMTFDNDQET